MSAPLLWIFLPIGLGGFTLLVQRERTLTWLGGMTSLILAGLGLIVPIDEALRFGPFSLKVASTVLLFGRSLVLDASAKPLLVIIYGLTALWFFAAEAAGVGRRLIPLGLIMTGLLVAAIAVQPFLFAALLIEIAVLIAIPLLSPSERRPGRGLIRFLIYQTLGMPFILFAGWLLAGVEASPGDLALTIESTTMLGLGFAFLLAIFPLYTWMPLLTEEDSPFVVGFIFWLLPTVSIIFGMGFLDRYAWLRSSPQLSVALTTAGLLMVVTGGLWAAFQQHFGRMMAYAAIAETGFLLIALGLDPGLGVDLVFLLIIPRSLGLTLWALSLSTLGGEDRLLHFSDLQGRARFYPLASAGLILSALSTAGFPLLAGFPPEFAMWKALAQQSPGASLWFLIGLLGLLIAAVRMSAVLVRSGEETGWTFLENRPQRILFILEMAALLVLGIFPQILRSLLAELPNMFQHLGH